MKRRIVVAGVCAALALAGCNAPVERSQHEEERQEGGWTASPHISAVERQGSGLLVRGEASPGARVVLRGDQDVAFAAGADQAGRFELPVGALPAAVLLTPEVRVGQFSTSGPERLLLVGGDAPGGTVVAALLVEGGASRRLSVAPALDSVDGDGQGLVVAGRAGPDAAVAVSVDGGPPIAVTADAEGRWTTALPNVGDRVARITVGSAEFVYPGPAARGAAAGVERSGDGWRYTRMLSPSARQTSWFPDA